MVSDYIESNPFGKRGLIALLPASQSCRFGLSGESRPDPTLLSVLRVSKTPWLSPVIFVNTPPHRNGGSYEHIRHVLIGRSHAGTEF